ncbi:MAG: 1-deoxy-D-xylulose-5-phosphate reductoisomerase [Clostridiales bacterium]|nr:1-deoxy-D-xylulose-5-phosphate reductoisomerase [Clostridiales bacterium]
MIKIGLIGGLGSIGKQTLNVVRRHSDKFKIVSLATGRATKEFFDAVNEFSPMVATAESLLENPIKKEGTDFYFGRDAYLNAVIKEADVLIISVVGFIGLKAVLKGLETNKRIALANKECLVCGGDIIMKKAKENGVTIIPIDSEHSAIFQALSFDVNRKYKNLILTASGGAFRDKSREELVGVKAKDALKHPNWDMGAKITIDSATMVNKGFEFIEAKHLFNAKNDQIKVVLHRESIIHSMVEFEDNAILAQLSYPSMEIPISLALTYPERVTGDVGSLDFTKLGTLTFEELKEGRYPCFDIVKLCAEYGRGYPLVVNASNEVLVKAFLEDKIAFLDIEKYLKKTIDSFSGKNFSSFEEMEELDLLIREKTTKIIEA